MGCSFVAVYRSSIVVGITSCHSYMIHCVSSKYVPYTSGLCRFNAHSLNNKFPELYHVLYSMQYDAVFVCESWLNVATPDSLLDPQHKYTIIRRDRQTSVGGSVCAIVSRQHAVVVVNLADCYSHLEVCCFDLLYMNGRSRCRFFVVYRSPSVNNSSLLVECLSKYSNVKYNCIIVGDLNCASIDWQTLTAPADGHNDICLLYTSPSPRDRQKSRMPSSA